MRHDDLLRHSRQLKQRRIFRQWLWFVSSLTALLVIVIIMANTSRFAIGNIKIEGEQTLREQDIKNTIDQVLEGRYAGLFSRRNVWLFPKTELEATLREHYPNLAAVAVSLQDKTTLVTKIQERSGVIRWCPDTTEVGCYFADDKGYIFAASPEFSHGVFLNIIGALPLSPIDQAPLDTAGFKKLLATRDALEQALSAAGGVATKIFQIKQEAGGDFTLMAERADNPAKFYEVRLNLEQDPGQIATSAAAALAAPALRAEMASTTGSLQYLDLRFAPKVFYKFQPGI